MRLSVSAATPAVPLPQIMFRGDLESVFRAARRAGFEGVDLFLESAESISPVDLRTLSERHGVRVALLSAMGDLIAEKVTLSDPDPRIRREFLSRAQGHLELAAEVGALVPVGFSRGSVMPDDSYEDYTGRLLAPLHDYDRLASAAGVTLVIEPINRYEINSVNRVEQALHLIAAADLKSTGLLIDLFHMGIEEVSVESAIVAAAGHVRHVHFVDSNRGAPGMGHARLKEAFFLLRDMGYGAFLGIESLPHPDPETAAALGKDYVSLLERQYRVFRDRQGR